MNVRVWEEDRISEKGSSGYTTSLSLSLSLACQ